jgi:hypothetical protein
LIRAVDSKKHYQRSVFDGFFGVSDCKSVKKFPSVSRVRLKKGDFRAQKSRLARGLQGGGVGVVESGADQGASNSSLVNQLSTLDSM